MKRLCLLALLLSGCGASESNPVKIEKIGERDGVTVYRFRDGGGGSQYIVKGGTLLHPNYVPPPIVDFPAEKP